MGRPERKLLNRIRLLLFGAVTWFVVTLLSEQLGAEAGESWFGAVIGPLLLPVLTGVAVVAGIGWLVLVLVDRPRHRQEEIEERKPLPITPLAFHPPPEPLFGRRREVEQARERVLRLGVVVLAGVRDVGTSVLAEHVTQWLIDEHGGVPGRTFRFDLRSRSTSEPYDAAATAARIVAAFGVDEPSEGTDEVLDRTAGRLLEEMPSEGTVLFLDNVSTADQVAWLVRRWPSGGWPRLVVAGETAVGDAGVGHATQNRVVPVGELDLVHLREIWDAELDVPEPAVRTRIVDLFRRLRGRPSEDPVDELLRACVGRPGAVKALAQEIRRLSAAATADDSVRRMLAQIRAEGAGDGPPPDRVWTVILDSILGGLTDAAVWLLRALAELPVTGITWGAIVAVLEAGKALPPGGSAGAPLEELRLRNLVREQRGRYRVPQEIRQALVGIGEPDQRRAVAMIGVPALVRYFARFVEEWAARLEVDTEKARAWFRDSEPSLRPLLNRDVDHDAELLDRVFDDLCLIADGLDSWYVREQQSRGLLEVSQGLYELALSTRREDVAALAACRIAAAHRLARRFGDAMPWLDIAQSHAKSVNGEVRAQLDIRERVERALLAAAGPEPQPEAVTEAAAALALSAGRKGTDHAVVLINLGMLEILVDRSAEAVECLREAEKVARDARDAGSEAHSIELQGVALAKQKGKLAAAVGCWQRAEKMFARTGEDAGEARCLQHLGAAALHDARIAGLVRDGRPLPLTRRAAAEVALALLNRAKELRTGQPDTVLVDHYLDQAGRELES